MRAATYTPNVFATTRNATGHTTALRYARNVALFLLAPFVGLAYAVAFPFVGLGMLAWAVLEK